MILTKTGVKHSFEEALQSARHGRLARHAEWIKQLEQEANQPSPYLMQPTRTVEQVLEDRK